MPDRGLLYIEISEPQAGLLYEITSDTFSCSVRSSDGFVLPFQEYCASAQIHIRLLRLRRLRFLKSKLVASFTVSFDVLMKYQKKIMSEGEFRVCEGFIPPEAASTASNNQWQMPRRCQYCEGWFTQANMYRNHLISEHAENPPSQRRAGGMHVVSTRRHTHDMSAIIEPPHNFSPVSISLQPSPVRRSRVPDLTLRLRYWIIGHPFICLVSEPTGWSLLHVAAVQNNVELLDSIMLTAQVGTSHCRELLRRRTAHGMRAIDLALCRADSEHVVRKLLSLYDEFRVPVFESTNGKRNCLHYAVLGGSASIFQFLFVREFAAQQSLWETDEQGLTPFSLACELGRFGIVSVMSQVLLDIDERNRVRNTRLSRTSFNYHRSIPNSDRHRQDAVSARAVTTMLGRTHDGDTPLMLALKFKHEEVAMILLNCLSPSLLMVGTTNNNGTTALLYACEAGCDQAVQFLLQMEHGPLQRHTDGATAWHLACINGHVEVIKVLLEDMTRKSLPLALSSLALAAKDRHNITPFQIAFTKAGQGCQNSVCILEMLSKAMDFTSDQRRGQCTYNACAESTSGFSPQTTDRMQRAAPNSFETALRLKERVAAVSYKNNEDDTAHCSSDVAICMSSESDIDKDYKEVTKTWNGRSRSTEVLPFEKASNGSFSDNLAVATRRMLAETAGQCIKQPSLICLCVLDLTNWNLDECVQAFLSDASAMMDKIGASEGFLRGFSWPSLDENCFCSTCMDDVSSSEALRLCTCGHVLCRDCWAVALRVCVEEKGPRVVCEGVCPFCRKGMITEDVWLACATTETRQRYLRYCARHYMENQKTLAMCPVQDCRRIIRNLDNRDELECDCGQRFCGECGLAPHAPLGCDEAESWLHLRTSKSELASVHHIMQQYKRCPRCNIFIEKNEGCMHMTCRIEAGGCGYEFCWTCGRQYPCRMGGACVEVPAEEWNSIHCTISPEVARASGISAAEEQANDVKIWEEAFSRCSTYEKQVQTLDHHIQSLKPRFQREQSTEMSVAIFLDSLQCARDIASFLRNLEIRTYYLQTHLVARDTGETPQELYVCRLQTVQHELRALAGQIFVLLSQYVSLEDAPQPSITYPSWPSTLPPTEAIALHAHCATVRRLVQRIADSMLLEEAVQPAVFLGRDRDRDMHLSDPSALQRRQIASARLIATA